MNVNLSPVRAVALASTLCFPLVGCDEYSAGMLNDDVTPVSYESDDAVDETETAESERYGSLEEAETHAAAPGESAEESANDVADATAAAVDESAEESNDAGSDTGQAVNEIAEATIDAADNAPEKAAEEAEGESEDVIQESSGDE
tara:strand:+ start:137960 stop:138397 length:438 start_codon:yes stop_codon:yes gene_type:complete